MKKFLLAGLAISLLCFQGTAFATTIRLIQPKIEAEVPPGGSYAGEVVAENPTDEEVKVRIYLEDWYYLPEGTGEKKFVAAGTLPNSASKWISYAPAEATIPPFGRITVRYSMNAPSDAKGGYYSVLFFETILGSAENEEGVNVLVAGRIGALFLVDIAGTTTREGEATLSVNPMEGNKPMQLVTQFKNKGNVAVSLSGNYVIMNAEGKVSARGDVKNIYTAPGDSASSVTEVLGRLPSGTYDAILTLDLGRGKSLISEKTFTIP